MSEWSDFVDGAIKLVADPEVRKAAISVLVPAVGAAFWGGRIFQRRRASGHTASEFEDLQFKLTAAQSELATVGQLKKHLDRPDAELWQFHDADVPRELAGAIHASEMKVLVFANLKGGVGKTTMAANPAAYFADLGNEVLLIDFDYQGSLTRTVLRAAGKQVEGFGNSTDTLLADQLTATSVMQHVPMLQPTLNHITLLPSNYALNRAENLLLMRWLLDGSRADPRFALARLLAQEVINHKFKIVIIDTPPRLTLATVNALCAATHVVVPTNMDNLAIDNVGDLLSQMDSWFRKKLNPSIKLAGIIGTMSSQRELDDTELRSRLTVEQEARRRWGGKPPLTVGLKIWPMDAYVFQRNVPDTVRFRRDAGNTIAYLDTKAPDTAPRSTIQELGQEIASRIKL